MHWETILVLTQEMLGEEEFYKTWCTSMFIHHVKI